MDRIGKRFVLIAFWRCYIRNVPGRVSIIFFVFSPILIMPFCLKHFKGFLCRAEFKVGRLHFQDSSATTISFKLLDFFSPSLGSFLGGQKIRTDNGWDQ